MLSVLRRHLNSWVARVFFFMLIAMFVTWGVGDVIRNIGVDDTSVATVAGVKIDLPQAQDAYRRQLQQVTRMLGGKEPTQEMRRAVASDAVNGLVTQVALDAAVANMGLAVPEDALRAAVFAMPGFHNDKGQFDRQMFEAVLNNNNMTEARFLDLVRSELSQAQLMEAARAGVTSPDTLTKAVDAFQTEKRVADMVTLPFSAAPAPPAPTEQQLTRWYENHKTLYSTPEYRRIEAVVLSPETLAKDVQVTDAEIKAAYDQHRADYNKPEKRSIQVLLTQDQAKAGELAVKWSAGADWAAMQKEPGATPVELTDAVEGEIPAPELAKAAFAAPADTVSGPVHSALGWHVFKVTKITPAVTKSLDDVRAEIKARIVADKAADLIYDRSSKLEDLLAGGATLESLPPDLGLAAVTGTLDAKGDKMDGTPAPIPGPPALVKALIEAAFAAKVGDPPQLIEAPHDKDAVEVYFALSVLEITPPAAKPMAEVADAVKADWTRDAVRHEQEEAATKLMTEVQGGRHLTDAAAGLQVQRLPPIGRGTGAEGVPQQLVEPLFGLKQGEATMVETPDGFVVAELMEIQHPDPNADPVGYSQLREALAKSIGDDVQSVLTNALRERASPTINTTQVDSLAQAD